MVYINIPFVQENNRINKNSVKKEIQSWILAITPKRLLIRLFTILDRAELISRVKIR